MLKRVSQWSDVGELVDIVAAGFPSIAAGKVAEFVSQKKQCSDRRIQSSYESVGGDRLGRFASNPPPRLDRDLFVVRQPMRSR